MLQLKSDVQIGVRGQPGERLFPSEHAEVGNNLLLSPAVDSVSDSRAEDLWFKTSIGPTLRVLK